MFSTYSAGVRRPLLYVLVATFAVAAALPLAIGSGQNQIGGLFDECYDAQCDGGQTKLAEAN